MGHTPQSLAKAASLWMRCALSPKTSKTQRRYWADAHRLGQLGGELVGQGTEQVFVVGDLVVEGKPAPCDGAQGVSGGRCHGGELSRSQRCAAADQRQVG